MPEQGWLKCHRSLLTCSKSDTQVAVCTEHLGLVLQRTAGPHMGNRRGIDKLRYSGPVQAPFQNQNAIEKVLKRGKMSSQKSGKFINWFSKKISNYIFLWYVN